MSAALELETHGVISVRGEPLEAVTCCGLSGSSYWSDCHPPNTSQHAWGETIAVAELGAEELAAVAVGMLVALREHLRDAHGITRANVRVLMVERAAIVNDWGRVK